MEVTVLSISSFGNDKVVKISVPSFQALLDYKPNVDEMTVVVVADLCPEKDITAIIALCRELNFTYEGRLPDAKASKPSGGGEIAEDSSAAAEALGEIAEGSSAGEGKNQV